RIDRIVIELAPAEEGRWLPRRGSLNAGVDFGLVQPVGKQLHRARHMLGGVIGHVEVRAGLVGVEDTDFDHASHLGVRVRSSLAKRTQMASTAATLPCKETVATGTAPSPCVKSA